MNYQKIYNSLVSKNMEADYLETHHIIPRCVGGTDDSSNLVKLTAKAHFIAHLLLCRIYPDNIKLKFTLNCMARYNETQERQLTASQYEMVKKENSIALSVLHSTRIRSEDEKKKISKALRGKTRTQDTKKKCSEWQKGKPKPWQKNRKRSEETKRKIGEANKGNPGKYHGNPESRKKQSETMRKRAEPSLNTLGYEILTPDGFKPFDGVAYSGLIPTLKFTLTDGKSITVSKKHRFDSNKIAAEYKVGEELSGSIIESIEENGKKHCYDILEVPGDHLYLANGIVNHNCEMVKDATKSVFPEVNDGLLSEIVRDFPKPPHYACYVSMDVGFKDLTVVLFGYHDFRSNKVIIEEEIVKKGEDLRLKEFTAEIWKTEEKLWTNLYTAEKLDPKFRVSDIEPIVTKEIYDHSGSRLYFSPVKKEPGYKAPLVNRIRMMLVNHEIVINPRCKTLIAHLKNGRWANNNKDTFARSPGMGHYDALDALIYMIKVMDLNHNPFPAGARGENYFHRSDNPSNSRPNQTVEVMRAMFGGARNKKR